MTTRSQSEPHLDTDQINAFLEGALSPLERSLCLHHLAECSHCREIAFLAGASLQSEEPAPARRFPASLRSSWWPVLSFGLLGIVAVVIALSLRHNHQSVPGPVQIAAESRTVSEPPLATPAPLNQAIPVQRRQRAVPKPSPAQKAPPKLETPILGNQKDTNTAALDSMIAAPAQPAAGTQQQLKESGRALHGTSNASAGPVAQSMPPPAAGAAKAAPNYSLRDYNGLSLRSVDGLARITGTVTDSSGATIPQAKITLDQSAGTAHRETLTDANGQFTIDSLQPGKYRLEILSPGFVAQAHEVDLGTNQVARLDSQLAVGSVSQTVAVNAAAPALDTESVSVQSVLPDKKPLQTSVISGARTLALDTTGHVFFSKKAGKHWKAVHGPWKRSAVTELSLTPDQDFKVTTAQGSWLSPDGEHWHPAT